MFGLVNFEKFFFLNFLYFYYVNDAADPLLVRSMINGGKNKDQSPSQGVKFGLDLNEKWVIKLNFVSVKLENMESLEC